MTKTRVLMVEDYEPFSRLLQSLLKEEPALQIEAVAADGMAALRAVEDLHPDLILLDIGLPKLTGIEVARRLRDLAPPSTIIFVTSELSPGLVDRAFELGARGYVLKTDAVPELPTAIKAVMGGDTFVSSSCRQCDPSTIPHRVAAVAAVTYLPF